MDTCPLAQVLGTVFEAGLLCACDDQGGAVGEKEGIGRMWRRQGGEGVQPGGEASPFQAAPPPPPSLPCLLPGLLGGSPSCPGPWLLS